MPGWRGLRVQVEGCGGVRAQRRQNPIVDLWLEANLLSRRTSGATGRVGRLTPGRAEAVCIRARGRAAAGDSVRPRPANRVARGSGMARPAVYGWRVAKRVAERVAFCDCRQIRWCVARQCFT